MHHQDGEEHLLAPQGMPERGFRDRGPHEESAAERAVLQLLAAGQEPRIAVAQHRDVARVVVVGGACGHGAEPVLAARRVADADRLGLREQRVDQRVGYLLVHIETRERRALLAAHAEGGAHDTARRALEIGARGDDAGILATHLGDARARNRRRLQRLHDAHADLVRAGEGRPGGERVGNQSGSDFGALAAEIVEHPGWQPRIADAVGEQAPRPRRGGGALQHDGVAGHERRGGRAARERERKVERRDDHPHPVGLEHATVVRGVRGEGVVGERAVEGAAALEIRGVQAEEVGGFLSLGQRL